MITTMTILVIVTEMEVLTAMTKMKLSWITSVYFLHLRPPMSTCFLFPALSLPYLHYESSTISLFRSGLPKLVFTAQIGMKKVVKCVLSVLPVFL